LHAAVQDNPPPSTPPTTLDIVSHLNTFTESLVQAWHMVSTGDAGLWHVVLLSLRVSGTATLLAAMIGTVLGAWLAVARFPGQRGLLVVLNTMLALPSVVVGLVVYLLLSRSGPLGAWGILFTPTAMVIAQTVLTVPVVAALTRQLVADAWRGNGEQLRSMGAGTTTSAGLLLMHERWSMVTVLLTAFGRAISEVGAVMIVGGNILGVTRVMTTSIALETSKGDLPLALGLGVVLLLVVGVLNAFIAWMQRRSRDARGAA
jgi:tungstate transport system permease protein